MQRIGQYLVEKPLHAGWVALLFTLLPLIGIPGGGLVAGIIVGLVTLTKGWRQGFLVLLWVAIPAVSLLLLKQFGGFDTILVRSSLAWVLAGVLGQTRSWRLSLELLAVLGLLAVTVVHLLLPNPTAWWTQVLIADIQRFNQAAGSLLSSADVQQLAMRFAPVATGFLAFVTMLLLFIQLVVARWWHSVISNSVQFGEEFRAIRLGLPAAVVTMILIVGALLKLSIAIDMLPVMVMPFMIVALSIVHFLPTLDRRWVWLVIAIYVALVLLRGIVVLVLALVGFADSWYDFRARVRTLKRRG